MMLCCPTCHQPIADASPAKALADARLSRTQRIIVQALAAAYPRSLRMGALLDAVYSEDPRGGPDDAEAVIRVIIGQIRRVLPAHGWTIPKNLGGMGNKGVYSLAKVAHE